MIQCHIPLAAVLAALTAGLCSLAVLADPASVPGDPTAATVRSNQRFAEQLPWNDRRDFELATRGLIDTPPRTVVTNANGEVVWDTGWFEFEDINRPAPDSVNPSLWRQAKLNSLHGLFKVTDRIYQVRGFDLSNVSIIEGDTGYIVVDPLITSEAAAAAMDLVFKHLPRKPVVAVIYSHSHADHFGGVKGVVNEADVKSGKTQVIASEGFMEFAVSENILAGNVMSRRASYMFGSLLPKNERAGVGAGLGKAISSGTVTLIEPTEIITEDFQQTVIDGLTFEFMNTPFAEAPAEMMFYIPELKAFYAAEEANATLHNLYTLRGAEVRDALLWSRYLQRAAELIDPRAEVLFGGHHWPRWEYQNIVDYLRLQGDAYKYIHDQTLRLANHGFTMDEIAEQLDLPKGLRDAWFNHGYYGTVSHNAKAVYQKYLGWFDGNPAHMHALPPADAARKYVEFMGGADAVLAKARQAFDNSEYRWVAEVVNHVIFADPHNQEARQLQAAALEQLGYQAESGQWRNFYLTGAAELRNGVSKSGSPRTASPDMISALTLDMFFDYMAVRLNGPAAADANISLNFDFTDSASQYRVRVVNGVLNYRSGKEREDADATVRLTRDGLVALALLGLPPKTLVASGAITVTGDASKLDMLLQLLDTFDFWFNIVTP